MEGGTLSKIATKVLTKIMYIARLARPDLLRAVGALTIMITKWTPLCDRKLFRIIKYRNGSVAWRQIGFIGDKADSLELGLFSDADFAGDTACTDPIASSRLRLKTRSRLLLAIAQSRPSQWPQTTQSVCRVCLRCHFGKGSLTAHWPLASIKTTRPRPES